MESVARAVYLEPVGTGGSGRRPTHPEGYTIEFYRHCAEKAIEHVGEESGEKVYFLGHSHGGFVAQDLALHRPDLLAGIILYDTAPVNGPLLSIEAARNINAFAEPFSGRPGLPAVLAAWRRDLRAERPPSASSSQPAVSVSREISARSR
jgi:pimeloyl-ACP methyl ester carboxylesterase